MAGQGSKRISKALTNIAIQYRNSDYIADKIVPDTPVKNESDQYWIYNREFRLEETARSNGSPANMATWEASTGSYIANEHAIKDVITERDRMNTDAPMMQDRDTTEYLVDKILMRREYDAAKLMFTTTTYSNNTTILTATSWTYNTTTSAPIQNVLSATGVIIKSSGVKPNTMVIGWEGFAALKENTNIYSRIQYVEKAILTEELLASLFDLQKVAVGTSVYQTNKEGETASDSFIWGDDALVAYINPRPGIKTVTAVNRFVVSQMGSPYQVKKWREEEIDGDYIEVRNMYAYKAPATSCGYLFKSVTEA